MRRGRIAIALAVVVFFVFAGTGVAAAWWSTQATVRSTVTAGVVGSAPACSAMTTLLNSGFETPVIPVNNFARSTTTGWSTGDPAGVELWSTGFNGVPAYAGAQFAEINGNFADTLSQTVTTTPGQTLTWSLAHRGRSGVDTMTVALGPATGPGTVLDTFSDGNTAWGAHAGSYVVPAGQTSTKISLVATASAGGDLSFGNFVDDVKVNNGPCLESTPVVTNVSRPAQAVMVGDTIRYTTTIENNGGSNALSSSFTPVIPTGTTYKPGTLTVAGVAKTDALGDDTAAWNSGPTSIVAYLGTGATSSAGGTLASGATTTVTFDVIVTSAAASGSLSFSTVTTFADPLAPTWPITAAPTTIGTPFTRGPDVVVVAATTPSPITGSATAYSWTFTVTNNGPGSATGVSVLVTAPTGLTITAATNTGITPTCTGSGTTRTCTIGTMTAAQSRTVTLTGTVASTYSSSSMAIVAAATSTTVDPVSANNSATNTATVTDGTVPSTPGTPTSSGIVYNSATLTWTGSTDNFGVVGYNVYRGGVLIGSTTAPTVTYTDTTVAASTTYSYTIRAKDAANNLSVISGARSVTTPSAPLNATSYYKVSRDTGTEYCMEVPNANSGTDVILGPGCTTTTLRDWRFVPSTGGYVKVNPRAATGMVWRTTGTTNGSTIELVAAAASTAQEWLLIEDNGEYQIQSRSAPTRCIERSATAAISLQTCDAGTAAQFWTLTER
jgi:uncharacterized repeat protein (TIGR01451 family)